MDYDTVISIAGVSIGAGDAMNLSGDDYGAYQSDEKLLPFDIETINRLRFDDGTQHVILEKQDDGWVLPEM